MHKINCNYSTATPKSSFLHTIIIMELVNHGT